MIRMRSVAWLAAGFIALAAHASAPRHPARHGRVADWRRVVTAMPDGGYRMGNPDAPVSVIEFFSFTCPHCAAFAGEAMPAIRDTYVRTGKVSFEMRSAIRDRADYVAALLAHCAGPQRFFPTAEAIFAAQGDWETRAIDYDGSHPADLDGADGASAIAGLASGAGLDAIVRKQGASPAALARCYADPGAKAAVKSSTEDAWGLRKISGTPAFLINGTTLDGVHSWGMLEPRLRDALKS